MSLRKFRAMSRCQHMRSMCLASGSFIGHLGQREVWVLDGKVYAIGQHSTNRMGDYFRWCGDVRAGKHPDFVPTPGGYHP